MPNQLLNYLKFLKVKKKSTSSKDPPHDLNVSKSYTSGNVNTFEGCFPSSAGKPREVAISVQYVVQIENSTSAAWNVT